jgi:CHAD domain-containing protein
LPRLEKWLSNVAPDTPADQAARQALNTRLRAVRHYLERATAGRHEVEAVHQLRIWTRRAAAALGFFQPATRRSRRRRLKRTLRQLRRAAGKVRDYDVHLVRLKAAGRDSHRRLTKQLHRLRRWARRKLKRLHRRLLGDGSYDRQAKRLLQSIEWAKRHSSQPPRLGDWSRQQLAPLAARFFALAEAVDLGDVKTIHALRIAGKRLRYALELTPTVVNAHAHGAFYRRLDEIQDRLGEICDHSASIAHLRQWRAESSGKSQRRELKALLRAEEASLHKLQSRMLRWWSTARRERLVELWQRVVED